MTPNFETAGLIRLSPAPGLGWSSTAAALLTLLSLGACGGGGGTGPAAAQPLGLAQVTVLDACGTAVPDAKLRGPNGSAITDAKGVALLVMPAPDSTADVTVSRSTFVDTTVKISSSAGRVNQLVATLVRATAPAGDSLRSRSGNVPTLDATGRKLSFEIELLVVQGNSQPVENLGSADFVLRACTPETAAVRNGRADCLCGAGSADVDTAYTPRHADAEQPVVGPWLDGTALRCGPAAGPERQHCLH